MPKTKEQKKEILKELNQKMKDQTTMLFVDFSGLEVQDTHDFRKKLEKANGEFKVAKKTMTQIALDENKLEKNIKELEGEIGIVFGYKDEITPAKVTYEFSKENDNLKILGGFFENKFESTEKFIELAQLPSKEELLGRLVGSISSPMTGLVRSLEYNIKGLIFALNAIKKNK